MPRMQLGPELDYNKEIDEFTGHLLQARLANFWKAIYAGCCHFQYDVVAAEERYEKFCHEYLTIIPSAFALQPDTQYDKRISTLPKQREIFHISILESLCYNFWPVLMQKLSHIRPFPKYKQVLLLSQQKALAIAALYTLKSTSSLYALMGNSYTRLVHIIRPTFEAAVLLVYLSMDPSLFMGDGNQHSSPSRLDPLSDSMIDLKEDQCTIAIQKAIHCLQTLADFSHMAEIVSRSLMQLLQKTTKQPSTALRLENNGLSQANEASGNPPSLNFTNSDSINLPDITMIAAFDHPDLNWEASTPELGNLLSGEFDL
ncbi:hypothetical protein N7495_001925 [Penicillium taxi]|uniref:uncharacterized protein n=1 Tax=Penicillium taxi TaxID=168475 RepID=UPI00254562CA|nr:uncharacterized protein N7495_001925 [Penicillium taxi]KAJ5909243.1 hypothetical protein N7495_001925 [Penicillium taxi]